MTGSWNGHAHGGLATVKGTLTDVVPRTTRQGESWATAVLTVDGSTIRLHVYPNRHAEFGPLVVDGALVEVTGRVDARDAVPHLAVTGIALI